MWENHLSSPILSFLICEMGTVLGSEPDTCPNYVQDLGVGSEGMGAKVPNTTA